MMVLLATALAMSSAAGAEPPPGLPPLFAPPLPVQTDPATRTFPGGVKMFGDVTYAERTGYRPLKLDLYLPKPSGKAAARPLVVWIHGGGYEVGNPRTDWTYGDWSAVLARLAARGYVVAGISYRLSAEARWPAQLDDAHAALAFLHTNAGRWGIDPARTYVWGLSAGGQLAALLGTLSKDSPAAMQVQGVVDWFGPVDFEAQHASNTNGPESRLFGCTDRPCAPEVLRAASPINHVSPATPPMLIIHGVQDHLVSITQSDAFAERLKARGVDVTYQRLPGLDHGFEGGSKAQQEQILLDTFTFFNRISARR